MQEVEARFWTAFGPILFGQPRAPETDQEWIQASRQMRALTQLDQLATRLEQAASKPVQAAQRPQARKQHEQAGSVYYNDAGEACCPQHERPLKQGKFGYFCSAKDPNGKNGYCDYRVKDA